jgi:hypothetical protein
MLGARHSARRLAGEMKMGERGRVKPKRSVLVISKRMEEIIRAVRFYRYMTAVDVTNLLYSPASLTHVRSILTALAGGDDGILNEYLYRFRLPSTGAGNREMVFTLGSRGRDFLATELGLPVTWYFRPEKVKHLSYNHVAHSLFLTRFLVAAHMWSKQQSDFRLSKTRIEYQLAKAPGSVVIEREGGKETVSVIPDAWLLFERLKDGKHANWFPILLEIDRGTEYRQKFKRHVQSRIEFIRSGGYKELFGMEWVTIAYVTTGERPDYRESRLRAMCEWTREVLEELQEEDWASVFLFSTLSLDEMYSPIIFQKPVWFKPNEPTPVPLF